MAEEFDLVVLGAGSTAFAAALRAAEYGKTVALTESRVLGGTCANRGCLPRRTSLRPRRFCTSQHIRAIRASALPAWNPTSPPSLRRGRSHPGLSR